MATVRNASNERVGLYALSDARWEPLQAKNPWKSHEKSQRTAENGAAITEGNEGYQSRNK